MGKTETFRVRLFGGYDKEEVQEYIQAMEKEIDNLKILYQNGKEELKRLSGFAEEGADGINAGLEEELKKSRAEVLKKTEALEKTEAELKRVRAELAEKTEQHQEALPEDTFQPQLQILRRENQELRETCKSLREQIREKEEEAKEELGDRELIAEILADARKSAELIKEDARQEGQEILKNAQQEVERQKKEIAGRINSELADKGIELIAARHKIARYVNEVKKVQEELYSMYTKMNAMVENMPVRLDNYWEGEHFQMLTEKRQESAARKNASEVSPAESTDHA